MIGIDTNVMVRFLVNDDVKQNAAARKFITERTVDDPAFLSSVALAETVWVLHRLLKFPMSQVVIMLQRLLESEGLIVEHAEALDALLHAGEPTTDLADHLVVWSGMAAGCRSTVTFDKAAAKAIPEMERLA